MEIALAGGYHAPMVPGGCPFSRRRFLQAAGVAAERIFGLSPRGVEHIGIAMESGLGISSGAQIRLVEG